MDAPTIVAIIGIAVPVFCMGFGYLGKVHQDRIKSLEGASATLCTALADFKLEHEKAMAEMQRETTEAVAEVERKQTAFELEASKVFITQPALLQVMNSLDKTLAAMGEMMKENQRETRAGLDALNKRIDSILTRPQGQP